MLGRMAKSFLAAYAGLPRDAWVLSFAAFINRTGSMVLPFLALYLTRHEGYAPDTAGVLQSVYGVGALAGSFLGGALSDRFGSVRIQVIALAVGGLGFLGVGFVHGLVPLAMALFAQAIVYEMLRPANATSLARSVPVAQRTQAMTLGRLAVNLGMASGAVLGGELARVDYRLLFAVDGGTSLLAALVLAVLLRPVRRGPHLEAVSAAVRLTGSAGTATPANPTPAVRERSLLRDPVVLWVFVLSTVIGTIFFQGFTVLPQYWNLHRGFDEATIGRINAVNMLVIVGFEMLIVHRLSRRDPLRVTALGSLLVGGGLALVPFAGSALASLLPMLVLTFGEILSMPFLGGFVARYGPEAHRGRAMGLYTLSWSIAYTLAPTLGAWAMTRVHRDAPWALSGALGIVLALGFLSLARFLARAPRGGPSS